MTILKAFALNVLMLAVTIGVLYWATEQREDTEAAQAVALLSQTGSAESEVGGEEADVAVPVSVRTESVARRPATFPLDLNSARMEDFMELPGIGETLARRMVDYRSSHGEFRSVEDLRRVRGIGKKRMERLRPLIVIAEAP